MEAQKFIDVISEIQFSQVLNWEAYILIALVSGLAGFLSSYFKEKGKNYASREDFDKLILELEKNTKLVEGIKAKVSERKWISQQIWVKKQEAYEVIFDLLLHVKKYVSRQVSDFENWEYLEKYHPYLQYTPYGDDATLRKQFENDKKELQKRVDSPEYQDESERLKKKYEISIENLLDLVEVKSIYLDSKVAIILRTLKTELSVEHDEEEWDDKFRRVSNEMDNAISSISGICKIELAIGK